MIERIPRNVLVAAAVLAIPAMAYVAYSRPWYFTNQTYMAGLIFLEFLLAALWMYRRVFFLVVLVSFLLAGSNLPVGTGWSSARWLVLGIGAGVGILIMLKDRGYHFGFFHLVALFTVLTGIISASVSLYPVVALLKVLSLLLLFVYAATGVRLAAIGRENAFFHGLLLGCEIFIGANAVLYAVGIEAMGNPNSLGAVLGVAGAPILFWGVLHGSKPWVYRRRLLLYAICIYLAFLSHARAGIGTALLSSAVLGLGSRRYKLLLQSSTVLVIVLASLALFRPEAVSPFTTSIVYKNQTSDVFASRISPWQNAMDNIRAHPWFGMGLGTTGSGGDADEQTSLFISSGAPTGENGSSYLAILAGVGLVGTVPAAILLILLIYKVVRTLFQIRHSESVAHPSFVLAAIVIAGIVHAAFEDWMFAPGNYLCVFFWSLAFLFNDLAVPLPPLVFNWRFGQSQGAIPSRL